jgi:hypothetical protein
MTTSSTITPELLNQLLANYEKPEDLTGEDGLFSAAGKIDAIRDRIGFDGDARRNTANDEPTVGE